MSLSKKIQCNSRNNLGAVFVSVIDLATNKCTPEHTTLPSALRVRSLLKLYQPCEIWILKKLYYYPVFVLIRCSLVKTRVFMTCYTLVVVENEKCLKLSFLILNVYCISLINNYIIVFFVTRYYRYHIQT